MIIWTNRDKRIVGGLVGSRAYPPLLYDYGRNDTLEYRRSLMLLLATQLEIAKCLRFRGIRTRQLTGHPTKTAQYRSCKNIQPGIILESMRMICEWQSG